MAAGTSLDLGHSFSHALDASSLTSCVVVAFTAGAFELANCGDFVLNHLGASGSFVYGDYDDYHGDGSRCCFRHRLLDSHFCCYGNLDDQSTLHSALEVQMEVAFAHCIG